MDLSWFEFLIMALAVARVADAIANDNGPFNVFEHVRSRCGLRLIAEDTYDAPEPGSLAEACSCPKCLSIWLGLAAVLSYVILPAATIVICLPFAISAVSSILNK